MTMTTSPVATGKAAEAAAEREEQRRRIQATLGRSTPHTTAVSAAGAAEVMRRQIDRVAAIPPELREPADDALLKYGPRLVDGWHDRVDDHGRQYWTWGQRFVNSPQWLGRSGEGVTAGAVPLDGYLEAHAPIEERAEISTTDVAGPRGFLARPVDELVAPISARCDQVLTTETAVDVVRWTGAAEPAEVAEGAPKQAADLAPSLAPLTLPFLSTWLPLTRNVLDDYPALVAIIDGKLRRALGLTIDGAVAAALVADQDIATVSGADLPSAIRSAIATLAATGVGPLTLLLNPADYSILGDMLDLPLLNTTPLPSAVVPAGSAYVADLRAAVQLRARGAAQILTTDSHADWFLSNKLVILAEQRAGAAITEPGAAVEATTD